MIGSPFELELESIKTTDFPLAAPMHPLHRRYPDAGHGDRNSRGRHRTPRPDDAVADRRLQHQVRNAVISGLAGAYPWVGRQINPALCLLLLVVALLAPSPAEATGLGRNYKEVYRPPEGQPARGVVLLFHGGGWESRIPALLDFSRPYGQRLARWGYVVWMVEYRPGAASLKDAVSWYRRIRAAYPHKPLCANGQSAGGHLALWVAVKTALPCVIDEAGPTDLATATVSTIPSFFPSAAMQRRLSPLTYAGRRAFADTRILVAHAIDDPVVPYRQSLRFHRRQSSRMVGLPSGDRSVFWVHSTVDSRALRRYLRTERRFLGRATRAQRRAGRAPLPQR